MIYKNKNMKAKLIALSMLVFSASATVSAQNDKENFYTPKWTDNIFFGVDAGIQSVKGDGLAKGTPTFSVSVGKYLTPTWGVRAEVGGLWQRCNSNDVNNHSKKYVGTNLDAMINFSTLFAGYNPERAFDVYGFVGPEVSFYKDNKWVETAREGLHRIGDRKLREAFKASAGLGLRYNINKFWNVNLEGRASVGRSVFAYDSEYPRSEGVFNAKIGVSYTFGGLKFNKVSDRVVEKEVIKEIVREIPVEVEKEVVRDRIYAAPIAVFFRIGKAQLSEKGKVNIKLIAETMKANTDQKYVIYAYCDAATGSKGYNQTLSEKRAETVRDALIAEGVSEDQLVLDPKGGTDNMFGKNYLNRVVILKADIK